MVAVRNYVDNAPAAALSSSINGTTTTVPVVTMAGFPAAPFYATIDRGTGSAEQVLVTAISGGVSLTVTRNINGLGAFSHSSGATLEHTAIATDYAEANAHHVATTGVHGVTGAVVGTIDAQTLTNKTLTSPVINTAITGAPAATLGATTVTTVAASGAVTGASVAVTGAVTGASAAITGLMAAGTVTGVGTVPTGCILPWAKSGIGNTPPTGWLACAGQAISRTTYAALFAVCSTIYGAGDGSTTFNLPDLTTKFIRGAGTGSDVPGNTGGAGGHSHGLDGNGYAALTVSGATIYSRPSVSTSDTYTKTTTATGMATSTPAPGALSTALSLGGSTAVEAGDTLPPYVNIAYIIKT